jgi:hypothetical protein
MQQTRGLFRLALAATAVAMLLVLVPQRGSGAARTSASFVLPRASAPPSFSGRWTPPEWAALKHGTGADYVTWTAILPVLFVGLLAPLELMRTRLIRRDARTPAAPFLPSAFQRPPPHLA